ncbi:DUF3861 domain-containing protein [Agarivorans sp. Alg241-V36]|uniref:DUF3861 domain-containing protein n=1 Tax=Agarivorans sp. Alg241-V36 TaxID=2305992 RepID=UPI0013D3A7E6|nr:DUF3861 domain-containing protein [Agarivorans sp. Alg241-V36]
MNSKISKNKHYQITIEELNADQQPANSLQFDYQDREDLFKLVEHLNASSGLENNDAKRLAVSLRLIGPLMMQNRKHPLFDEFFPHFKTFMQHLKSSVKQASASN